MAANTELRLDKFLAAHTSEDNESFVELMEESERKRKEKQAWLYQKEGEQKEVFVVVCCLIWEIPYFLMFHVMMFVISLAFIM